MEGLKSIEAVFCARRGFQRIYHEWDEDRIIYAEFLFQYEVGISPKLEQHAKVLRALAILVTISLWMEPSLLSVIPDASSVLLNCEEYTVNEVDGIL